MPRRLHRLRVLAASLLLLLALTASLYPASAESDHDPLPPMRWGELQKCYDVVVARYESHDGDAKEGRQTLRLRVVEPLRGDLREGTVVSVILRHRYQVVNASLLSDPEKSGGDTRPVLWYSPYVIPPYSGDDEVFRTGGAKRVQTLSEPAVYFLLRDTSAIFPGRRFLLERFGQVHPAEEALDWQHMTQYQEPPLLFRLLQDVDQEVMRAALEELYVSRDPKTLDALVERVAQGAGTPGGGIGRAAEVLKAIGDRNGEVYDRATLHWKSLAERLAAEESEKGQKPVRVQDARYSALYALGEVRAGIAPERYLADLTPLLAETGPQTSRRQEFAVQALHGARTTAALDVARDLLRHPRLGPSAASALASLLQDGAYGYHYLPATPPQRSSDTLRRHALPWLPGLIGETNSAPLTNGRDGHADQSRRHLSGIAAQVLDAEKPRTPPSLAEAERVFFDPDPPPFSGSGSRPGDRMLERITIASDARYVPLLIRLLKERRDSWQSGMLSAVKRYAVIAPNAMVREMHAQGVTQSFAEASGLSGHGLYDEFMRRLGLYRQNAHWLFADRGASRGEAPSFARLRRLPFREMDAEARTRMRSWLGAGADGQIPVNPNHFRYSEASFLLRASPEEGRRYLERALAARDGYSPAMQASLLALAVQSGRGDLKDTLRASVRHALAEEEAARARGTEATPSYAYQVRSAAEWLLLDPEPDDIARYLAVLDARREMHFVDHNLLIISFAPNEMQMNEEYSHLLARLFDAAPAPFFDRVLYLLESPLFAEREAGAGVLRRTIYTDLGFDHTAFAEEREARLAKIRPLLARLSKQPGGGHARLALLREWGVTPRSGARDTLGQWAELAGHPREDVAANALLLMEEEAGVLGLTELRSRPADERARSVATFLRDREEQPDVRQKGGK
ncbi:MAG TPA: hypothetical protein VM490_00825 [Armatimonadaceae bacterium]|nr:hypothetical protein [Armatimonadaceae bacterium]